jgi:CO dehydrogenase maturation factor
VARSYAVINRVKEKPGRTVLEMLRRAGLELAGTISENQSVYEYDLKGRPSIEMPEDNPAVKEAFAIFDRIIG